MSQCYRLHFAPDNASLVIRIALSFLDVPYTCELVDRTQNAQSSEGYRTLNPLGMIPALETPHGALFETGAIVLWLGDIHNGARSGFLPSAQDPDRGHAPKWLFFLSNSLHATLRQMFYAERMIAPQQALTLRKGLAPRIRDDFARINGLITSGEVFGTGQAMALDIYAACLFRFAQLYPASMPGDWVQANDYSALQDLCRTLETLRAVQDAQRAEGLGPAPFSSPIFANPPIGSAT